jgi:hypothetical protein
MFHPANTQKLFSGVMITVFAGILILGVAGPAGADSIHSGKLKAKITCDNGISVTKNKLRAKITLFQIQPSPSFPNFILDVTTNQSGKINTYSGSGVVMIKKRRAANFQAEVVEAGDFKLYFTGKFIINRDTPGPEVIKASGRVFGFNEDEPCILVGKFKTKADPALIP